MYLIGVYLIGVHLIGMYLRGVHLMGVHFKGLHLSYELYELCNCSITEDHVALVVVEKWLGRLFVLALASLLPTVVVG